jgi:hypothetical protein
VTGGPTWPTVSPPVPAPPDPNQEMLREAHREGLRELRDADDRVKAAVKRWTKQNHLADEETT